MHHKAGPRLAAAGRVADIHYLLPKYKLQIHAEHFQKVEHNLLARKNTNLEDSDITDAVLWYPKLQHITAKSIRESKGTVDIIARQILNNPNKLLLGLSFLMNF